MVKTPLFTRCHCGTSNFPGSRRPLSGISPSALLGAFFPSGLIWLRLPLGLLRRPSRSHHRFHHHPLPYQSSNR